MSKAYDGEPLERCSQDVLQTRILHLGHDLDKTLTTLLGSDSYLGVASSEAGELARALEVWRRRGLPEADTVRWASAVLQSSQGAQGLESEPADSPSPVGESESVGVLEACIMNRRSVRKWQPDGVPREIVERILVTGTWAPSACNRQSVRYLVLEHQDARAFIAGVRESYLASAPVHIVLFAELANYFPEEGETVPFLDAGMAAQNMLLAAHAMGLGAVFVKCTPRDLAAVPSSGEESSLPVFKARFNVPRSFIPVGVIGVGWPAARPKAPPRRGLQEVVCTEEFSPTRQNLGAVHRGSPAKRLVKRAFVRGAYAAGRRLGLRVFIASE